jgi:N-acetylmuramoyl-L-alanine amidase
MTVTLGRTDLPTIDSMSCPAVAVEVAPQRVSDASKATGLDDPAVQTRVAEALAAALVEWRAEAKGGREP